MPGTQDRNSKRQMRASPSIPGDVRGISCTVPVGCQGIADIEIPCILGPFGAHVRCPCVGCGEPNTTGFAVARSSIVQWCSDRRGMALLCYKFWLSGLGICDQNLDATVSNSDGVVLSTIGDDTEQLYRCYKRAMERIPINQPAQWNVIRVLNVAHFVSLCVSFL